MVKKTVVQPPERKMGQDGIVVLFCALVASYPRGTGPMEPLSRRPTLHFGVEEIGGGSDTLLMNGAWSMPALSMFVSELS